MLLKPDVPVRTVDECFRTGEDPASCHVYSTHSDVHGVGRVHYLFSNDDRPLTASMLDLGAATLSKYILVDWYLKTLAPLRASQALPPSYEGTRYAMVVPILAGDWVLLGEMQDKYVPLSTFRFEQVDASADALSVRMLGSASDVSKVCAAKASQLENVVCKVVTFGSSAGSRVVRFEA